MCKDLQGGIHAARRPLGTAYAILETSGKLSVIPKSQKRPVTPGDLNIPTEYEGISTELIIEMMGID